MVSMNESNKVPLNADVFTGNTRKGVVVLVLGIISFVCFGPFVGIPTWVIGRREMKKIKAGKLTSHHKGLLRAGIIFGILGTFVTTFFLIDVFLYFLVDIMFP
jgi:hypothetical protein